MGEFFIGEGKGIGEKDGGTSRVERRPTSHVSDECTQQSSQSAVSPFRSDISSELLLAALMLPAGWSCTAEKSREIIHENDCCQTLEKNFLRRKIVASCCWKAKEIFLLPSCQLLCRNGNSRQYSQIRKRLQI